jgi:hypothetical protein
MPTRQRLFWLVKRVAVIILLCFKQKHGLQIGSNGLGFGSSRECGCEINFDPKKFPHF